MVFDAAVDVLGVFQTPVINKIIPGREKLGIGSRAIDLEKVCGAFSQKR
jgi:hypothetical protein